MAKKTGDELENQKKMEIIWLVMVMREAR